MKKTLFALLLVLVAALGTVASATRAPRAAAEAAAANRPAARNSAAISAIPKGRRATGGPSFFW